MMEKIIHFIITYNDRIISVSVAIICLTGVFWAYRLIFGPKQVEAGFDFSQVEESLKKILAQTNNAIANTGQQVAAQAAGTAPAGGPSAAELESLKKELEARSKLIEQLKAQVDEAIANDGTPELLSKIKDLEAKLAEYEIIEDDIADLSNFKDENAKLKKEIENLRSGGARLVDEFAATVADGGASTAAPAAAKAAGPKGGVATDAEAMSGISASPAAAQAQNVSLDDAIAAAQSAMPSDVAPPDETTPMMAAEELKPEEVAGDIFAEFSGENADPLADLGDLDTDRMLEELQGLEAEMGDASALDEAPDMDKMANEATSLKKG